jgi:hypothetical protein
VIRQPRSGCVQLQPLGALPLNDFIFVTFTFFVNFQDILRRNVILSAFLSSQPAFRRPEC